MGDIVSLYTGISGFLQQFTNRELAIATRILVLFLGVRFSKIRDSLHFKDIIKRFFHRKIFVPVLIFAVYQVVFLAILFYFYLWNTGLLKDSIFSIIAVVSILFSLHEKQGKNFIISIIRRLFQRTILIEFIGGIYTFSYLVELVFISVTAGISYLTIVSSKKTEGVMLDKFLNNFLTFLGVFYFIYIVSCLIKFPDLLLNFNTIFAFFLPIILTLRILPLAYFYKLICDYEILFARMSNTFRRNEELRKSLRKKVFSLCKLNRGKLMKISESNLRFRQETKTREDFKQLIDKFQKLL